ncbi:unnamed protein product [Rotaria sp. Silwood2]|nr:unnamed protein product [Rotaria sp. Silwood2]CAF3137310.1 unnamed protein product [Rotaria sp. Silwood2]CAF3253668.1 unnamed protein product [Rotaria sp. Silwood2]CAF3438256.1 unnamed protein product [Rotaria sp. Silwood2]CAF4464191.1 unnamed protein product [Rotaria sp. Silwood2]
MASNSNQITTTPDHQTYVKTMVKVWLMSIVTSIAIICSVIHLYQLFTKRVLREALNNHAIIVLNILTLCVLVLDVPFYLGILHTGYVWFPTPAFCLYWWNIDEFCYQITLVTVAVASVQRHFLIFHEKWLSTAKKRFFIHYIPICLAIAYPILFNVLGQFVGSWCTVPVYDYTKPWCQNVPCFMNNTYLHMWDMFFNWVFIGWVSFIADLFLITRVLWHRRIRLHQPIVWRKHRKMTIQLLSISLFSSSFNSPMLTYTGMRFFKLVPASDYSTAMEIYFVYYFSAILLSLVMILSLPKEYWWGRWRDALVKIRDNRRRRLVSMTRGG